MSLSLTTPGAEVDVKKEDVVVEEVDGSCAALSFTAREAYVVLKLAMKSVFLVYDVRFQGLTKSVKPYGEDLFWDRADCDVGPTV